MDSETQILDVESRLAALRTRRTVVLSGSSEEDRERLARDFARLVIDLYDHAAALADEGSDGAGAWQQRAEDVLRETWGWAAADSDPWVRRFAVQGLLRLIRWHADEPRRVDAEVGAAGRLIRGTDAPELADLWVEALRCQANAKAELGEELAALDCFLKLQEQHGDSDDPYMWLVLMRAARDRAYLLAKPEFSGKGDPFLEIERCVQLLDRWEDAESAPEEARWTCADLLDLACSLLANSPAVSQPRDAGDGSDGDGGSTRELVEDHPLSPADSAYAVAVWRLADRFGTDPESTVRGIALEALSYQGNFHRRRLQLTASVAAYRRALDLSSQHGQIWTGIAQVGMNLGFVLGSLMRDEQAAVEEYRKLFAMMPDAAFRDRPDAVAKAYSSWLTMLERLMTKGELDRAELDGAVLTGEQLAAFREQHQRAFGLSEAGDFAGAIAGYDRVLSAYPDSGHPLLQRMRADLMADKQFALQALGRKEESVLVARTVLVRFGDEALDLDVLKTLGRVSHNAAVALDQLGRPGDALEFYDAMIDRWADVELLPSLSARAVKALREKGITLEQDLGRPDDALEYYRRAYAHLGSEFDQVRVEAAYAASNLAQMLRRHMHDPAGAISVLEDCERRISGASVDDFSEARMYLGRQLKLAREALAAGPRETSVSEAGSGRRRPLRWPWRRG